MVTASVKPLSLRRASCCRERGNGFQGVIILEASRLKQRQTCPESIGLGLHCIQSDRSSTSGSRIAYLVPRGMRRAWVREKAAARALDAATNRLSSCGIGVGLR